MACAVGAIIQVVIVPALQAVAGAQAETIRFVYDPKPEQGIPLEARDAGTASPEPSQPNQNTPGVGFRRVLDLKDYGALRNVIHGSVSDVKIRYFDTGVIDRAGVEPFLKTLLASDSGSTQSFVFWAERLGVPVIEAYIQFQEGSNPGYLLVWSRRAAYRDPSGKWWFNASLSIGPAK